MQILIVDDDPVARQILRSSLVRCGYQVIEKADGQAAWEYLQTEPVRFMITDWVMPCMEGLELIRKVRAANFSKYIYMIILTGKGDKGDMVDGLSAGADDYLVKPFDLNELRARVMIGKRILDLEDRLHSARDQMEIVAMHDSTTDLLNRRAIYNHAEAELNRAQRDHQPCCLAMIDIDHFKNVNDHYGHLTGDRALRHVADCIVHSVRSYDWVGRWGGDEFLVVFPNTDPATAAHIAERIRATILDDPLSLANHQFLPLQVSMGITIAQPGPTLSLDTLIQQTDESLYQAKESGRNRFVIWQNQPEH
jgi:diguanylate cyclase (GGDEF)-like protein